MTGAERQLLETILTEVRKLRLEVRELRGRSDDAVECGVLISAIAEAVENRAFTATELVRHAEHSETLREALAGIGPRRSARRCGEPREKNTPH